MFFLYNKFSTIEEKATKLKKGKTQKKKITRKLRINNNKDWGIPVRERKK